MLHLCVHVNHQQQQQQQQQRKKTKKNGNKTRILLRFFPSNRPADKIGYSATLYLYPLRAMDYALGPPLERVHVRSPQRERKKEEKEEEEKEEQKKKEKPKKTPQKT